MSEKDFARALLQGESQIDVQALTERVLKRDRRGVRSAAVTCVLAWLGGVMLIWATILPMAAKFNEYQQQINSNVSMTQSQREESMQLITAIHGGTIAAFLCSVGSVILAAALTVWFVIVSRRATLRQVNARLAEISDQIKTLARPPG